MGLQLQSCQLLDDFTSVYDNLEPTPQTSALLESKRGTRLGLARFYFTIIAIYINANRVPFGTIDLDQKQKLLSL